MDFTGGVNEAINMRKEGHENDEEKKIELFEVWTHPSGVAGAFPFTEVSLLYSAILSEIFWYFGYFQKHFEQ